MVDRKVERNKETSITIGSDKCLSCEFLDPQGKTYFINRAGQCSLTKTFKSNHAGVWHVNCNHPGKMEPLVYKFNLTVAGKHSTGIIEYNLEFFLY